MSIPGLTPYSQSAVPITQRAIAAASILVGYTLVGSVFGSPPVMLLLYSSLDALVQLSFDGSTDWFPIPAGGTMVLDEKTNGIVLSAAKGIYVKRIGTPTTGSLYVGGFTI